MYLFRMIEMTPTQRAANLTYDLLRGCELSSSDIAEKYGMTTSGAHRLAGRIAGAGVPITFDGGVWRVIDPAGVGEVDGGTDAT